MQLGLWVLEFFGDALPTFSDAEGVTVTAGTFLFPLMAGLSSLGVWIPWALITTNIGIVFAVYLATAGLKVVLRIVSHVPFIGGAG